MWMLVVSALVVAVAGTPSLVAAAPSPVPEPDCICLEELQEARGFRNPLSLRHAGDGSNRRFVAEQVGLVWVFLPSGKRLPEPFLNLTHIVISSGSWGDHRGFLQLAFHPQYKENGQLYVYYTLEETTTKILYSRLSEMKVRNDDPNKVNYTSERELISFRQPFAIHNGGDIHFGLDGYLYLSLGDGGSPGDPLNVALDTSSHLGKILRIDVNTQTGGRQYGIPPDNPFLGQPGALPELYAIGLRNPWRCDVDQGDPNTEEGHGRFFIADVGDKWMEEVDILEAGGNYAWPAREGTECYKAELCGKIGPEVWPIHTYNHTVGRAIIGGHVYRGCQSPGLNGLYFFADFVAGRIFRLRQEGNMWRDREVLTCGVQECTARGLVGIDHNSDNFGQILSFGEDEEGEEYYLMTDFASPQEPQGKVFKMVDPFNRRQGCDAEN